MGVFSYKNFNSSESKSLLADALALTTYSYHNLNNGFAYGYHHTGFATKFPLTLITALIGNSHSQGIIPGLPGNPDSEKAAKDTVNQAGWYTISPEELGYNGKVDSRGTFFGETFGYGTAQAEVMGKYDNEGNLIKIGIAFRGTSGPREILIPDTIGDVINDLLAAISPEFADNYAYKAFGRLLENVADFASRNGLSGSDIIVSGHSLGGMATNSMAALSDTKWGGFFSDSQYVAFASPTQYEQEDKVLNVGYENDPVFRVLYGNKSTEATLGIHDAPHESTTDNIVNFNDYYSSKIWNLLPFSIINLPSWLSHMPFMYDEGLTRILNSDFYSLTSRDSTIIVANLSDATRSKTWVQDLNRSALPHTGPTFIIGSDYDDLIQGGRGNDYLEGGKGNDTFRDSGGYNIISGGEGWDTFDLQRSLSKTEIAYDGNTLYIRDPSQGITITHDVEAIRSKEPYRLFFNKVIDHHVTDDGLQSGSTTTAYAHSVTGDDGDNIVTANKSGDWLFGLDGNDILVGNTGNHTFVGGAGDDTIYADGGNNTFLFEGGFGHDIIYGFNALDKLIFMGIENATGQDYHDFIHEIDSNLVFDFGHSSVTLVDINMSMLEQTQVILT